MSQSIKIRENKLRRAAERQGLKLEKSRLRDVRATLYGTYHLATEGTNQLVAWGSPNGYGLTLDDIEKALNINRDLDDLNRAPQLNTPFEYSPGEFKPFGEFTAEDLEAAAKMSLNRAQRYAALARGAATRAARLRNAG